MLKIDKNANIFVRYGVILLGSLIYAAAISLFLDPNHLAPGGVTGIAIIINHLSGIPTGILILCINVPLLIVGVYKFGFKFLLSTMFAILVSSAAVDLLSPLGPLTQDRLLASLSGGALMALGMGLIFRAGATTGGSDIIVRLIKLKYRHVKTGRLFLITDMVVVAASAIVFGDVDIGLYAALAVTVSSTVFDMVLYGADGAKLVYIITDNERPITERILKELEIGVTHLKGVGAYTEDEKRVIMCAMRKQLLPEVQEIATQEDPFAFLIVTSANEIFGEGFKDIKGERL